MIKFLKNGSARQKNNQKRKRLPFEGSLFLISFQTGKKLGDRKLIYPMLK